jgi:hypothetical protein
MSERPSKTQVKGEGIAEVNESAQVMVAGRQAAEQKSFEEGATEELDA